MENRKELLKTLRDARDSISHAMCQLESLKRDSENPIHPTLATTNFMELKNLLDSGELKLEVGDRVRTRHRAFGEIVWTVIGVGVDAQPAEAKRPTVTLHMTNVLDDMYLPFDTSSKQYRWGHNAWDTCNLRKWLNGHFLSGFPEADREAMIRVEKTTCRNDDEGGKAYTTQDKLFLLSASELGFTGGDVKNEGAAYPFYENSENRKKTDTPSGDKCCYWLRSPTPWNADSVRIVASDGALNSIYASLGYGAAAACAI